MDNATLESVFNVIDNRLDVLFRSKDRYEYLSAAESCKEMKNAYERLIDDCNHAIGELSLVRFDMAEKLGVKL